MPSRDLDQSLQLALAHHQAGRLAEAEEVYRQILALQPDYPNALHYLGVVLYQKRRHAEAWELMQRAIVLNPSAPHYYCNAAPALLALGRDDDAIGICRQALALRPQYGEAFYCLGLALRNKGQFDEAVRCYRKAIELKPDHFEAWNALGLRLRDEGLLDEALECCQRAAAINPKFADAHNNLGLVLRDLGRLDEALAAYQRSLPLEPHSGQVRSNIAVVLKDMGDMDDAIAHDREALAISPDPQVGSNLLYTLLFHEGTNPRQVWEEHQRWNEKFARPLAASIRPHENQPDPDRRIRLGYLSPNFSAHPVGRFLFPLLVNHDHSQFEVFCYADTRRTDAVTELMRPRVDVWRQIRGTSDEQLAGLIRQDRIDILVDLTMHMGDNRMLVFARKPAPVQVTYLAYPGTTGLDMMDYRLTDAWLDPPGQDESFYSEKSVRLRNYWCYQPARDSPPIVPPPAMSSGRITFGCLNNFCKMTPGTFTAWCELLRRLPDSRLILHAREGSHRQRTRDRLAAQGIDPRRLEFVGGLPMPEYFAHYNQIDIALDPFPYPGGTTTCDALWMGVPVVTLPRETAISRWGVSILFTLGLTELIANDVEHYVRLAADLARDVPRLAELRSTMRQRMRASPLTDIDAFRLDVEAAFRRLFRDWAFASLIRV